MNLRKSIVSVGILVHFGAILAVVLSAGSDEQPSYVFMRIREPFTPYLQSMFLESPYRFYAPNPSHDDLIWIRVERAGQPAQWIDWPTDHPEASGSLSKRYSSMTRLALEFASGKPAGELHLSETSSACFSSIIRGIVRTRIADVEPSDDLAGKISLFFVRRRFLTPELIRAGQRYDDIRLLQIMHIGDYKNDGSRVTTTGSADPSRVVRILPTATFLAEILRYDSELLIGNHRQLPEPVDRFLRNSTDELNAGIDGNLEQSIERLLAWPEGANQSDIRRKKASQITEPSPAESADSRRTMASREEQS